MSGALKIQVIDRRTFMVGAANAAALLGGTGATGFGARAGEPAGSVRFEKAYRDIVGTAVPSEGLISLTLPDLFDNGHAVPFSIAVESEMTETSYISEIHMLSTANPVARVALFHLSPANGAAIVSGRFRLAKSQDVFVLARRNDGALFVAKQLVKVTIGGCS